MKLLNTIIILNFCMSVFAQEDLAIRDSSQKSSQDQCVRDICGTEWIHLDKVYEDLNKEDTIFPEEIDKNIRTVVKNALSLFQNSKDFLDISKDPLLDQHLERREFLILIFYISIRTIPNHVIRSSNGLYSLNQSFDLKHFKYPQLVKFSHYLLEAKIFQIFIEFMTYIDGFMFLDTYYTSREEGLENLIYRARLLNDYFLSSDSEEENIHKILSSLTTPSFYRVLKRESTNIRDITDFIETTLRLLIITNLFGDPVFEDHAKGFDIESFLRETFTQEMKESYQSLISMDHEEFSITKSELVSNLQSQASLYFQSKPNEDEAKKFLELSKNSIITAQSLVRQIFSRNLSKALVEKFEKTEFSFESEQSFANKEILDSLNSIKKKIAFFENFQKDKFLYFLLLTQLLGQDNILNALKENLLDLDLDVSQGARELSSRKGPVIITGWHGPKLGPKYQGILLHELAHKIEFFINENLRSLEEKDLEKINAIDSCLKRLHPEKHMNEGEKVESQDLDSFLKKGFYASEDFADSFAALSENFNFACFWFQDESHPQIETLIQKETNDDHSSIFFRLLLYHTISKSKLPETCKEHLKAYHNSQSFENCLTPHTSTLKEEL